jgi:hypothetical protein
MTPPRRSSPLSDFGIRISFGFRYSDFGFRLRTLLCILILSLALDPTSLWACTACFGQSDSPLAAGMNWGILTLLATIVTVLGAFIAFFVFLARRAATAAAGPSKPHPGRASVSAKPGFLPSPDKLGLASTLALTNRTDPLLESTRSLQ